MALSIKDPEADRLARALAETTGESLTEAVKTALRERLERERNNTSVARKAQEDRVAELHRMVEKWSAIPDRDKRTADEIIGYGDAGHLD